MLSDHWPPNSAPLTALLSWPADPSRPVCTAFPPLGRPDDRAEALEPLSRKRRLTSPPRNGLVPISPLTLRLSVYSGPVGTFDNHSVLLQNPWQSAARLHISTLPLSPLEHLTSLALSPATLSIRRRQLLVTLSTMPRTLIVGGTARPVHALSPWTTATLASCVAANPARCRSSPGHRPGSLPSHRNGSSSLAYPLFITADRTGPRFICLSLSFLLSPPKRSIAPRCVSHLASPSLHRFAEATATLVSHGSITRVVVSPRPTDPGPISSHSSPSPLAAPYLVNLRRDYGVGVLYPTPLVIKPCTIVASPAYIRYRCPSTLPLFPCILISALRIPMLLHLRHRFPLFTAATPHIHICTNLSSWPPLLRSLPLMVPSLNR
ncbi:hypothetical protein C7M84_022891 [Penaeus vannamei]|uniref:Uncharacterized protein n=1 Tax=Penaeus vannamei TaxID=6689 RepID=A0A3R7ND19_PENVA|nr:hypothetical protein C7M84_022891 [Penaeus vannamei]